jgi:hypothetical protein
MRRKNAGTPRVISANALTAGCKQARPVAKIAKIPVAMLKSFLKKKIIF